MKMSSYVFQPVLYLLCVLVLSACSESPGGGGIDGTGKIGPTIGSGVVIGQVNSVDNLVIDGREYQVDEPEVVVNGKAGALTDIRVGMSVKAEVNKEQLTVSKIDYHSVVAGPIEMARNEENALVILGQQVVLSGDTYLDSLTSEDLFEGEVVEVGGDRGADNTIVAEYIRGYGTDSSFFVVGQIETSPADEQRISVSGTQIDFQPVIDESGPDAISEFVTGSTVRAEVEIKGESPDGLQLTALGAEVLESVETDRYESVDVNGVVTSVSETGAFVIRKITFQTNSETEYFNKRGSLIAPVVIVEGNKLKVEGLTLGDGTVLATSIIVKN
jgi:hypothetical protein